MVVNRCMNYINEVMGFVIKLSLNKVEEVENVPNCTLTGGLYFR